MPDVVSPEVRSRMMSGIRGRNTKPELVIRRGLHALGFRFRLHDNRLPGSPDLVFPKHRAVVFVNGCFWHGHEGCRYYKVPQTRRDFWLAKIEANRGRDSRNRAILSDEGWRVGTVWECSIRQNALESVESVAAWLGGAGRVFERPEPSSEIRGRQQTEGS